MVTTPQCDLLGIRVPVIQAPVAASPRLAAADADAFVDSAHWGSDVDLWLILADPIQTRDGDAIGTIADTLPRSRKPGVCSLVAQATATSARSARVRLGKQPPASTSR